jgi:[ribosomal protein S5]-alanine N-acetyltransferase
VRAVKSLPTPRTAIRLIQSADAEDLAAALSRDRDAFALWQPAQPAGYYTKEGQESRIQRMLASHRSEQIWPGVVLAEDVVIGQVTIGSIVQGPFRKASLGYWIGTSHQNQGHGSRAVSEVLQVMAGELGLHRAEASTQMENIPSQRILRSNGFVPYGIAHSHIFLNDKWRDGVLWERTLE